MHSYAPEIQKFSLSILLNSFFVSISPDQYTDSYQYMDPHLKKEISIGA